MVDTVDTMVASDVMPTLNQKLKPMPTMADMVDMGVMVDTVDIMVANAVVPKLNQKLKPMPTMDMVDMEVIVDTVDTMAASADLLNHTTDTEDMVDTDTVDTTEDEPSPQLSNTITRFPHETYQRSTSYQL